MRLQLGNCARCQRMKIQAFWPVFVPEWRESTLHVWGGLSKQGDSRCGVPTFESSPHKFGREVVKRNAAIGERRLGRKTRQRHQRQRQRGDRGHKTATRAPKSMMSIFRASKSHEKEYERHVHSAPNFVYTSIVYVIYDASITFTMFITHGISSHFWLMLASTLSLEQERLVHGCFNEIV